MAKLTSTTYTKPAPVEKENPFLDAVKGYTDKGVDTAFAVEFAAEDYAAEKLLIQRAVNAHGFSAREVQTDASDDKKGKDVIKSTFLIRPARKSKGEAESTPEADAAETAPEADAAE